MPALVPGAIAARLAAADNGTTAQKGQALEDVVAETFCLLDGVGILARRAVDIQGSSEIDILLYNSKERLGLSFVPADNILIECKNWHAPVDTSTLRAFVSKLRQSTLTFGILVAANGITGDPFEQTAAEGYLRREFDQLRIIVLVITRAELEAIRSTEEFALLLRRKHGEFIMGVQMF